MVWILDFVVINSFILGSAKDLTTMSAPEKSAFFVYLLGMAMHTISARLAASMPVVASSRTMHSFGRIFNAFAAAR